MLDPRKDARPGVQPIQPTRQAPAQLREDWFERTYEHVRDFLDDLFR